jgi:outer membrane protein
MKKLIVIAIAAIGLITQVQAQKLGHVNFEEVITMLPERAAAEKQVQELQKTLEARLSTMIEAYQSKVQAYEADQTSSQTMKTSAASEISDLQRRIQEFQQTAVTEIETKQNELMGVMLERVRTAAATVGKTGSYTYIFDSSNNGGVLYAGGEDVTPLVKKELGI